VDAVLDIKGGDYLSRWSAARIIDWSHNLLPSDLCMFVPALEWVFADCCSIGGLVFTATWDAIDYRVATYMIDPKFKTSQES